MHGILTPDKKYGEEIAAWIWSKEKVCTTPDEIRNYCTRRIAHHNLNWSK